MGFYLRKYYSHCAQTYQVTQCMVSYGVYLPFILLTFMVLKMISANKASLGHTGSKHLSFQWFEPINQCLIYGFKDAVCSIDTVEVKSFPFRIC